MNVRKFSKAGVDTIDGAAFSHDSFDHTPRFCRSCARRPGKGNLLFAPGYRVNLLECQSLAVKFKHKRQGSEISGQQSARELRTNSLQILFCSTRPAQLLALIAELLISDL